MNFCLYSSVSGSFFAALALNCPTFQQTSHPKLTCLPDVSSAHVPDRRTRKPQSMQSLTRQEISIPVDQRVYYLQEKNKCQAGCLTGKRSIPSTTTTMTPISSDSKSENAENSNHRQAKQEYRRTAGRKRFVTLQRVLSHDVRSL